VGWEAENEAEDVQKERKRGRLRQDENKA